ncbi:DUF4166 domain-containing protein (plasmid) [Aquicoccus sp. G2-2]|uniref:DUF4166 domain-containing protein n=1 Tax=Aquicoccus sp. G2-2 TaxID=3092120 RepID=UPI002ADF6E9C|nr:DUF4166 domain-containing protein [Aquicoccus sp. G2-2]MEA1111934.1 DUF4166 domain-containing protein [Aquicoccus sp. G2-2]
MKVLILGGYGVFGGRLAVLLSDIGQLQIVISGRNLARATDFCNRYEGLAQVKPLRLDRDDIAHGLADERPDLVVDASGPFQEYGTNRYHVIKACLAAKVNYLDFADAADFVFGVSQFDDEAKAAEVFVLSGVSSFPVLTAAVLREISKTMDIVSVAGGIAPSPYAGIGLNVMRAVVGYAGEPVKLLRNGLQTQAYGLTESMRFTIAVPGRLPLNNIHFSLVDVPDLQVIPPEHDTLKDIWMGAGPVPESLHRVLNFLAKTRATLAFPSLVPLSGLFYKVLNLTKYGEHRGGMFVHARGLKDGQEVEKSWHLLAEGDDGPFIPSMAIEAIIRKSLADERPTCGARPATSALKLADYDTLFEGRMIFAALREQQSCSAPVFRQVLGSALDALPDQLIALHDNSNIRNWSGHANVRRGTGWFANIIAKIFGFPQAATRMPVTVTISPERGGELWTRNFDGKVFSSFQKRGTGRNDYLLVERFGWIDVALALVIEQDRLFLIPRRWSCFGISLPRFLLPAGQSFETEKNGRFCFDIEITAPLFGLIVAYQGELEPLHELAAMNS